jgi:hypothetical protein
MIRGGLWKVMTRPLLETCPLVSRRYTWPIRNIYIVELEKTRIRKDKETEAHILPL